MTAEKKSRPGWWIYNPETEGRAYPPQLETTPPWLAETKRENCQGTDQDDSPASFRNFYLDPDWGPDKKALDLINAALYLRKPMLIKGNPGVGKSSLAYSLAYKLKLGPVLRWNITSQTSIRDGLYKYDAIGYATDTWTGNSAIDGKPKPIFHLKALGAAIVNPNPWPVVLLIDEIDKSDMDLPNDLLHVLDEGRFRIDEWMGKGIVRDLSNQNIETDDKDSGWIKYKRFPIIIMTTNEERPLPAPFLRRCITIHFENPTEQKLITIVQKHFYKEAEAGNLQEEKIKAFVKDFIGRSQSLSTDALLGRIQLYLSGVDAKSDGLESLLAAYYASLHTENGK